MRRSCGIPPRSSAIVSGGRPRSRTPARTSPEPREVVMRSNAWFPTVVLQLAAATATAAEGDKRPWTVEDMFRVRTIGELQLAPGGERVLLVLSEKDLDGNASHSSIWSWSADDG